MFPANIHNFAESQHLKLREYLKDCPISESLKLALNSDELLSEDQFIMAYAELIRYRRPHDLDPETVHIARELIKAAIQVRNSRD